MSTSNDNKRANETATAEEWHKPTVVELGVEETEGKIPSPNETTLMSVFGNS